MAKTLFSGKNWSVSEEGGKVNLVMAGETIDTLDGIAVLKLAEALVNQAIPASALPTAKIVEGVFEQLAAALE